MDENYLPVIEIGQKMPEIFMAFAANILKVCQPYYAVSFQFSVDVVEVIQPNKREMHVKVACDIVVVVVVVSPNEIRKSLAICLTLLRRW